MAEMHWFSEIELWLIKKLIKFIYPCVTERTSYFCLARKLIWPLGSTHIFTQWGWPIQFSPDHFSGQHQICESPPIYLSLRTFRKGQKYLLSAPFIAAASQHHEESHLIYGLLESTPLDQGFPVEYELDACNQPHTGTLLCRPQPLLCRQRRAISIRYPATSSLGNIFWRLSCFSPTTTRTTHSWVTTSFLSLTSKHDLCYTYGDHISRRHSTMP